MTYQRAGPVLDTCIVIPEGLVPEPLRLLHGRYLVDPRRQDVQEAEDGRGCWAHRALVRQALADDRVVQGHYEAHVFLDAVKIKRLLQKTISRGEKITRSRIDNEDKDYGYEDSQLSLTDNLAATLNPCFSSQLSSSSFKWS